MGITHFEILKAGYCTSNKSIALHKAENKTIRFPALAAIFEHDKNGLILFDTGYASHFFRASKRLPYSIYRRITPVFFKAEEAIKYQLHQKGISPKDIRTVIISHFHGDHIGGLKDFPNAKFVCHEFAFQSIENKKGLRALLKGFLPDLIPANFRSRLNMLKDSKRYIYQDLNTWDLFDDGSIILQKLDGHADGQLGLRFKYKEKSFFLVADAAWLWQNYQQLWYPSPKVKLFFSSWSNYINNLQKLHQIHLYTQSEIIPTHCEQTIERIKKEYHV
ncbi:MAG: MBL fold metallo-hydrolase [Bacteroidetes bacterium]|jgi:glyoxylase-like metal-dependent hydrolase (beta-lactamase superfamily II)|nr:MBL fold metallo-hydrolase [Bacteroidota bacterium]